MPEHPSQNHPLEPLSRLMSVLKTRELSRPAGSYTTRLMDGGVEKIADKIREEADEMIEAAEARQHGGDGSFAADSDGGIQRDHLIYEAGDLIYHTLVLLAQQKIDLAEVAAELARREGTSGLVEKASRKPQS